MLRLGLLSFCFILGCSRGELKKPLNPMISSEYPRLTRQFYFKNFPAKLSIILLEDLKKIKEIRGNNTSFWYKEFFRSFNRPVTNLHGRDLLWFLEKHVVTFAYSNDTCFGKEVACVYPQTKKTVFITPEFFKLDQNERISTVLHEAFHNYDYADHIPCQRAGLEGKDCDQTMWSSYGFEACLKNNMRKFCQNCKELGLQFTQEEVIESFWRVNQAVAKPSEI